MGVITIKDVVNDMLSALGEAPVNSLTDGHTLVTSGLNTLRLTNIREQSRGWWFNTERVTLTPNNDGVIFLPDDTLKVDPVDTTLNYAQRGRQLYNMASGSVSPTTFTVPVDCILTRLIPFEEAPTPIQLFVAAAAQLKFHMDQDGDQAKLALLRSDRQDALMECNAEHIRSVDANLLNNPSTMATLGGLRGSPSGIRYR